MGGLNTSKILTNKGLGVVNQLLIVGELQFTLRTVTGGGKRSGLRYRMLEWALTSSFPKVRDVKSTLGSVKM